MSFEFFIALRYLLAGRKQAFISLISLISTIGVAVGVMALLVALALMTGLQAELRDRIIGAAAHVYVFKVGGIQDPASEVKKLREVPRVIGAAPVVMGKGLISGVGQAFITIKGIDPELEKIVTHLDSALRSGSMSRLVNPDGPPGILIGLGLAETLEVEVGDVVQVATLEGVTTTPMGPFIRPRAFRVAGIFSLGLFEYDSAYGFVPLDVAVRILGREHPADYVELRVDDMFKAEEVVESIVGRLGAEYLPQDWADLNRNLFSALWLEKMAISITIGLIVMVAALNIIASLILLVMEKNRDIAILKTMGTSSATIRRVFMLQGLIIGLAGTTAGAIGGGVLIYVFDHYKLIHIPTDVYQISYVPFTLRPLDFAIVVLSAIFICFVATIYPSRLAAKLDPAVALRYQ